MIDNGCGAGYTGNTSTSLHNRKAVRLPVIGGRRGNILDYSERLVSAHVTIETSAGNMKECIYVHQ